MNSGWLETFLKASHIQTSSFLSFSVCGAEDQNGMYLFLFGKRLGLLALLPSSGRGSTSSTLIPFIPTNPEHSSIQEEDVGEIH